MPQIFLSTDDIANFEEQLPEMTAELRRRFKVETADFEAATDEAQRLAQRASSALEGETMGSDTDSPYWPCVLAGLGADPWAALGIPRDQKVSLSGWESPRLELREVPVLQALSNLNDDTFRSVDDYIPKNTQAALLEAGKLLSSSGAPINLRMAFPEESAKLIFVGTRVGDRLAGVVAISIET